MGLGLVTKDGVDDCSVDLILRILSQKVEQQQRTCVKSFETVPQSLGISLVFCHNVGIMIAFGLLKQEIIVVDYSPVSATITG